MDSRDEPTSEAPQVFTQSRPSRVMGLLASAAAGLVVAGVLSVVVPPPVGAVLVVAVLAIALWVGVRSMLSRVALTADHLHYRGVVRSVMVPRDRVVSLSEPGARPATLFADVPVLVWRDGTDDLRRVTLWCLPLGVRPSSAGTDAPSPRDGLRRALELPGD